MSVYSQENHNAYPIFLHSFTEFGPLVHLNLAIVISWFPRFWSVSILRRRPPRCFQNSFDITCSLYFSTGVFKGMFVSGPFRNGRLISYLPLP
ncbi:uncharacterized protein ASPGLDRAFT_1267060 [Aspergillus glaucus CBS 516.65]|uniref:Uncharacterized protein n=1 Tax=Aspergillus glaucus CBS 516.65 TaxID=1160497 RepID=A0A1L9VS65_ASPGL|nr:hypothetical protein ASPGLDRAFT_1267060 [Aspergillus glaucus CBS 516.65]OJJ86751.1 hypothetical protein ASPGLDRAFT_1267060 [Aspergillus glaucus CBS 516.65]